MLEAVVSASVSVIVLPEGYVVNSISGRRRKLTLGTAYPCATRLDEASPALATLARLVPASANCAFVGASNWSLEMPDNRAKGTVPLNCAAGNVPSRLLAVLARMAYGVGVSSWRGFSVVKLLTPFVSTPIANQLVWPVNTPGPKSTSTVNSPLVTMTPLVGTGPATALPPLLTLNSENVRLYVPLAGLPLFWSWP